jgi:hypothetical protein
MLSMLSMLSSPVFRLPSSLYRSWQLSVNRRFVEVASNLSIGQSISRPSLMATVFGGRLTPLLSAEQRYLTDQHCTFIMLAHVDY